MWSLTPFDMVYDQWLGNIPLPNLVDTDVVMPDYQHLRLQHPYITDSGIERYCYEHQYPIRQYRLDEHYPAPSLYPIGIDRFDINTDYFALMLPTVRQHLVQGRMLAVFFIKQCHDVHEIGQRLAAGVKQHGLPWNCYRVVVPNTMVDLCVNWFCNFNFAELEYWSRNQSHPPLPLSDRLPQRDFTILCRQHQPWRALAMTQFQKAGLLKNSYWSYGNHDRNRAMNWSPIDVNQIPDITQPEIDGFLSNAPYRADAVPLGQQSDLSMMIEHHFNDSHVHVVLESTMEAHGGSVLSEKVFKPIKHGQPFVILGTVSSLRQLQGMGYRIFDNVIDPGYDGMWDHNERYLTVYRLLRDLKVQGLDAVRRACQEDVEHNRQMFMEHKQGRLAFLQGRLTFHFLYTNNDYGDFGTREEIFAPWNQQ